MKTSSLIVVSAGLTLSFHIFGVSQADDTTITITGHRGRFATGEH